MTGFALGILLGGLFMFAFIEQFGKAIVYLMRFAYQFTWLRAGVEQAIDDARDERITAGKSVERFDRVARYVRRQTSKLEI